MKGWAKAVGVGVLGASAVWSASAGLVSDPAGAASEPAPPWRLVGLPKQKLPLTRYRVVSTEGGRAIEIDAQGSYGNLVHEWATPVKATQLSWRWRIERDNPQTDLRQKSGDDHAAAVCVLFDHPLEAIPFFERQLLRLARVFSGEDLPAATLCYAWDPRQRAGTVLDSPYTRRVRWLVLRGSDEPLQSWRREQRDLREDFVHLFGDESRNLPPLKAVLVAGDADNTLGRSLALVGDLALQ
ncbi:MAG: DUF3047 domain-containing protein [Burkholderiaceae bacterium]|nr:DUF3047 domain-containing protein [Burkholderiaceae bacterium]